MHFLKKTAVAVIDWFYVHIPRIPTVLTVALARLLPLKNDILLESKPDFADNTDYVFQELVRRGYNQKYRLIWVTHSDYPDRQLPDNVFVLNLRRSFFYNRIKGRWIIARARFIIDCNGYVHKTNPRTIRIHLKHGLGIKSVPAYNHAIGDVDLICVSSEYWIQQTAQDHLQDPALVKPLGFPRNDILMHPVPHEQTAIIWMPTYRFASYQTAQNPEIQNIYQEKMPFGLPCLQSHADFDALNRLCAAHDAVLYIRLHPVQDHSQFSMRNYSNIRICDNAYLEDQNKSLYAFLTGTDALITDYSSVYYDYLLLDKPIALTIADFDEYSTHNGLLVNSLDQFKLCYPAEYIENFADLQAFIESVCAKEDPVRAQRNAVREKYMGSQTDHAAASIVDYMETHFNLKG